MTISFYASYGLTCQTHQCKKLALLIYIWTLALSWEKPVPREQLAQGHGNKTLVMGHSRWPTNSGRQIFKTCSPLWFGLLHLACSQRVLVGQDIKAVLSYVSVGVKSSTVSARDIWFLQQSMKYHHAGSPEHTVHYLKIPASLLEQEFWRHGEFPDNFSSFNLLSSLYSGL